MRADEAGSAVADLAAPSMVCDGCAEKIRAALMALPGVRDVKVSLLRERVRVRDQPHRVAEGQLRDEIGSGGFAVTEA